MNCLMVRSRAVAVSRPSTVSFLQRQITDQIRGDTRKHTVHVLLLAFCFVHFMRNYSNVKIQTYRHRTDRVAKSFRLNLRGKNHSESVREFAIICKIKIRIEVDIRSP
jgi:hypothetical protein